MTKIAIVCYLWVENTGIQIYYHSHLLYSRPIPKGHWDAPRMIRNTLTHTLQAQIVNGVMHELWEALMNAKPVKVFPAETDQKPEEADLGL